MRVPDKKGFGSKLLRSASAQFHGHVDQSFEPDGLKCTLRLELAKLEGSTVASLGPPTAPDNIAHKADQPMRSDGANAPVVSAHVQSG